MELLVVTWAIRFAFVAGVGAAAVSLAAGAEPVDAVLRALIAVLVFLLAARFLLNRLETPEQKLLRMRARYQKKAKQPKGQKAQKASAAAKSESDPAATRAVVRSRSA